MKGFAGRRRRCPYVCLVFGLSSMTASRQERHKEGRYPTVNRLTPAEVRLVVEAVEVFNDRSARRGGPIVDVLRVRRVLRG